MKYKVGDVVRSDFGQGYLGNILYYVTDYISKDDSPIKNALPIWHVNDDTLSNGFILVTDMFREPPQLNKIEKLTRFFLKIFKRV